MPALDRDLLDAAEFNNASSDRLPGFADVSTACTPQSHHQSAETFELMLNRPTLDALPDKMKAIDRCSKDHIELQTKDKVKFYKTPDGWNGPRSSSSSCRSSSRCCPSGASIRCSSGCWWRRTCSLRSCRHRWPQAAFYLKGVSPRHVTLNEIFAGMMPLMGIQVLTLALLSFWPQIGLWLPDLLYK